jgi:SAM-dependent methyltransferase
MEQFVHHYLGPHRDTPLRVLDVGSQLVVADQTTYRSLFDDPQWTYVGLDVTPGINVDVAVADPYRWDEVDADSFDVVISGQALEHIPYFWLTAFEICRVLRPGGITMLVAPSSGFEHRYPVDCWRFYRDGMDALAAYVGCEVLDSYTEWGRPDWADSILVMRKPQWDTPARDRFDRRRRLQYAAAFDMQSDGEPGPPPPPPSALADAPAGALSPILEQIRIQALPTDAPAAAAEPEPAPAPPAAPTVPDSPRWRNVLRRLTPAPVLGWYRRLRYGR